MCQNNIRSLLAGLCLRGRHERTCWPGSQVRQGGKVIAVLSSSGSPPVCACHSPGASCVSQGCAPAVITQILLQVTNEPSNCVVRIIANSMDSYLYEILSTAPMSLSCQAFRCTERSNTGPHSLFPLKARLHPDRVCQVKCLCCRLLLPFVEPLSWPRCQLCPSDEDTGVTRSEPPTPCPPRYALQHQDCAETHRDKQI